MNARMKELLLAAATATDEGSSLIKVLDECNVSFTESLDLCQRIALVLRGYVNAPGFVQSTIDLCGVIDGTGLRGEDVAYAAYRHALLKRLEEKT